MVHYALGVVFGNYQKLIKVTRDFFASSTASDSRLRGLANLWH